MNPKYRASSAIAAAVLALGVFGSGAANAAEVMLPEGADTTAFTPENSLLISPGGEATIGGVVFSCAAGLFSCNLVFTMDNRALYSGGTVTAALEEVAPPPPPPPPPPTDRENAEAEAETLKDEAMTASENAGTAATDAEGELENRASVQSSDLAEENADGIQMNAAGYAAAANSHAEAAKTAADNAAEEYATITDPDTSDVMAGEAMARLKDAHADAMDHAMKAAAKKEAAMEAAAMEVKVTTDDDDMMVVSVGETSITIDGVMHTQTVGGKMMTTGMIDKIMVMSDEILGEAQDSSVTPTIPAKPGAEARDLTIGAVYDSDDDATRLVLVSKYTGKKLVNIFRPGPGNTPVSRLGMGNTIDDDGDGATANPTPEKSLTLAHGDYYRVLGFASVHMIGTGQKPEGNIYRCLRCSDSDQYWQRVNTSYDSTTGKQTHTYNRIQVHVRQANIPAAKGYDHISFGIWYAIDKDMPSGLGSAFVDAKEGSAMTGDDMPNFGAAEYKGSYVAVVQNPDESFVSLNDKAMLSANFEKGTVGLDLAKLVMGLKGKIDGDMFMGSSDKEMTADANGMHGIPTDTEVAGSFTGAFFGARAKEAGGVFDYMSTDDEMVSNFRGAFGARR